MDSPKIEALKDWFSSQDIERKRVFGSRCSLRGLPQTLLGLRTKRDDAAILTEFRRAITLSVSTADERPKEWANAIEVDLVISEVYGSEVAWKDAASATAMYAAEAAMHAAGTDLTSQAFFAAAAVANAVKSSTMATDLKNALDAYVSAALFDASALDHAESSTALNSVRIWQVTNSTAIPYVYWPLMRDDFLGDDATWGFWKDWYQGLLDGREPDVELWHDIAVVPDGDWNLGPAHIARKIEEIKARHLAAKLPLAETVEFNQQSGKFFFSPLPIANPTLLGAALSQAADALEDALTDARNGLQENSRETRVLRRTFARYGNDPQRIEMDFTTIQAGLVRQIATDELPASEENLGLIRALEEGALGIRATHPEVAQNRKLIETQAFAELPQAALDLLSGAMPILVDITEGQGQLDWQQDIPAIVDASKTAPPSYRSLGPPDRNWALAVRDEKVRVIGRAARMYLKIKETPELIHEIDKNASYKGARILATLHSLISFGRWIVSFF